MGAASGAVAGRGSSLLCADNVDGICVLSHCPAEHLMVIAWQPAVCTHAQDRIQHYVSMKLPSEPGGKAREQESVNGVGALRVQQREKDQYMQPCVQSSRELCWESMCEINYIGAGRHRRHA